MNKIMSILDEEIRFKVKDYEKVIEEITNNIVDNTELNIYELDELLKDKKELLKQIELRINNRRLKHRDTIILFTSEMCLLPLLKK